jgi:hypothetical protein
MTTTEELFKTSARQRAQKQAVTSDTQKENPSRGDLRTVQPDPTSGRELTKRELNTTEEYRRIKKKRTRGKCKMQTTVRDSLSRKGQMYELS